MVLQENFRTTFRDNLFKLIYMKILIVNPSSDLVVNRKRQPLSLAWIASILRNSGYFIKLIDMNALGVKNIEVDDEYDWLVITSAPLDRWETPRLDYSGAIKIVKFCKEKGIKTILIGPHGTVTPELILKQFPEIDIIVRGEPEKTVEEIISGAPVTVIRGISYYKDGKITHNPDRELIDLNELPIPAYDVLPMEKYHYNVSDFPKPFTIIESSRGCPYRCVFCFKAMHGNLYRPRTPENVIKEIEYLVNNFNIKSIYFQDLEFTLDKERVIKICQLIRQNNWDISWGCASRVQDIDEELLMNMKLAGCKIISFGVESLSNSILNNIKKGVKREKVKEVKKMCDKHGITFNPFYTQGHIGESKETIIESLRYARLIGLSHPLHPGKIIPYPGTELFDAGKIDIQRIGWRGLEFVAGKVNIKEEYDGLPLKAYYYYLTNLANWKLICVQIKNLSKKIWIK